MSLQCASCGRFFRATAGAMWRMVYVGAIPEPHREIYRCAPCVEKRGPFYPQPEIRPEFSAGYLKGQP